jgi:hypothetical protein
VPPITFNTGPHDSVNTCAVPLVWSGSKWEALKKGSDPFVCGPKS